jgi:hypothetical protein
MNNCLDTGTIQAFLDGELEPAGASGVSAHIALCDACAAHLATAEEESAFVFSVLERETDTLVPTQRLWNKINESIEVEKHNLPRWQKAWNILVASLANPAIAVAAVAVIVFGISTVVFVEKNESGSQPDSYIARDTKPAQSTQISTTNLPLVDSGSESDPRVSLPVKNSRPAQIKVENEIERTPRVPHVDPGPQPVNAGYIPGEESYVKTIATLNKSVDTQKDAVLRPSERVSYERDMAVVDDAITKMRNEVRKNPKNESAKQVLYSSYQNKIDLLNSVSQREELVASLK